MLATVLPILRCPVCGGGLAPAGAALRCPGGHTFDVARQGYVNLLTNRAPASAETPPMLAARADLFAAGHLARISQAIVANVPEGIDRVLDVGAGTGAHLAAVLDARPGSAGVALDVSKAAARHCARAHPAAGAVVANVWGRLPLADGCVDVVLDVFAPRHGAEFHRVLRPDGTLIVVTPTARHLRELVEPLGLLSVDAAKARRLDSSLGPWFEPAHQERCEYGLTLTRAQVGAFVAMGPSAWHTDPGELALRLAAWPEPVPVTVSVQLTAYRRRPGTTTR